MSQTQFCTHMRRSSQPTAVQSPYIQMRWGKRQQALLQRYRIAQHAHSCLRSSSNTNWRMHRRRLLPWHGRLPKFQLCDVNSTDTIYTCPSNYVCTNANKANECSNVTTDRAVIKCRNTSLKYVLYPKDLNIYGLCFCGKAAVFRRGEKNLITASHNASLSIGRNACWHTLTVEHTRKAFSSLKVNISFWYGSVPWALGSMLPYQPV